MQFSRLFLLLLLPVIVTFAEPTPGAAQQPTVDATATGARIERLAVLDEDGLVIPEDLIRSRMKPPGGRRFFLFGSLLGLIAFTAATRPEGDCSIYEPCSPREKYREKMGPWVGLTVGTLVGLAFPDGVDREAAVKAIRTERRIAKLNSP